MTETEAAGKLFVSGGGAGSPTLVLLHGLAANAAVWQPLQPFLDERWRGRWIAPDLRGHGRSRWRGPYGFGMHAADVAALLPPDSDVIVIGHSMGGAIAMALGSGWFAIRVRAILAFSVKLVWTREEVDKIRRIAEAPVRFFARREDAVERYLRVSGLHGLVDRDSPIASAGVMERREGFCVALDPLVYTAVGPDIADIAAACRAPLRLAAGSGDAMVNGEEMRRIDPHAVVLDGLGHNLHVEAPEKIWRLLESTLQELRPRG